MLSVKVSGVTHFNQKNKVLDIPFTLKGNQFSDKI